MLDSFSSSHLRARFPSNKIFWFSFFFLFFPPTFIYICLFFCFFFVRSFGSLWVFTIPFVYIYARRPCAVELYSPSICVCVCVCWPWPACIHSSIVRMCINFSKPVGHVVDILLYFYLYFSIPDQMAFLFYWLAANFFFFFSVIIIGLRLVMACMCVCVSSSLLLESNVKYPGQSAQLMGWPRHLVVSL